MNEGVPRSQTLSSALISSLCMTLGVWSQQLSPPSGLHSCTVAPIRLSPFQLCTLGPSAVDTELGDPPAKPHLPHTEGPSHSQVTQCAWGGSGRHEDVEGCSRTRTVDGRTAATAATATDECLRTNFSLMPTGDVHRRGRQGPRLARGHATDCCRPPPQPTSLPPPLREINHGE